MPEPTEPVVVTPDADADFIPGYILRNVGVPITLYRLVDGARVAVSEDEGADHLTEKAHLRFDANAVATVEDLFDGLQARVPVIERTAATGSDGTALSGPAGPVYSEKVVGYEDRTFYGLEAFQKAMEVKTGRAIRDVMAVAFRCPPEVMGERMVAEHMMEYQNAVGVAWSIAQGVDPTEAARMLHRVRAAVAERRSSMASELTRTMDEALGETTASPGNLG